MNGYGPSGATASVSSGSQTVTVTGGDISMVKPGMTIYFGSRDKAVGNGYLIASPITPNGTPSTGGVLTLQQSSGADSAQSSVPFLIDLAYSGSPDSWAAFALGRVLNALSSMLGSLFSLGANDRQLVLDRQTTSAASRLALSTAGVLAAYLRLVTVSGADKIRLTTSSDGTALYDAIEVDKATGVVTVPGLKTTTPAVGDSSTAPATTEWVGQNDAGGWRNLFRNASFEIAQRGTSGIPASLYTLDGWVVQQNASGLTIDRVAGRSLTTYALKVNGATGVTASNFDHRLESLMASTIAGRRVTAQYWVYNGTSGSITPNISAYYSGSQDNFASGQALDISAAMQACPPGAWTRLAYTWTPNALAANGYLIRLQIDSFVSGAGKYIVVAEPDFRATPGVAAGLNANPPIPELRPAAVEQVMAERYLISRGYLSGSVVGTGGATSSTNARILIPHGTMRVAPTGITVANAAHFSVQSGGSSAAASALAFVQAGRHGTLVDVTTTGLTAGQACHLVTTNADASIQITGAEL